MAAETVQSIVDYISSYDGKNKEMLIIPVAYKDVRKGLHEILESTAPWVGKTSFKSECFPNFERTTRLRCFECANSKSWPAQYHTGIETNNIDEYYRAQCGDCDTSIVWEPNFDDLDDVVRIYHNNCVILGRCFQSYANDHTAVRPRDRKRMLALNWHVHRLDKEGLQTRLLQLFGIPGMGSYFQVPVSMTQDFADNKMSKRDMAKWLKEKLQV